jgi:hypothetical protein
VGPGSFVYLVLVGSIGVFLLYLFVLGRWTASASSYILLLAPLAAAIVGFLILGEAVSLDACRRRRAGGARRLRRRHRGQRALGRARR